MKYCGNCGSDIDENAFVCFKCGAPQRTVAPQGADSFFGFKKPGEYGAPSGPMQSSEMPGTEPIGQPVIPGDTKPGPEEEPALKQEGPKPGEYACENCSGMLIFSLAKGLWYCPSCGTEAPNLPPPYSDDEPEEEDEALQQTQQMLTPIQPEVPVQQVPQPGMDEMKPGAEKGPEEVDGVTRSKATESIKEIQNLIEAKSKQGLYSMDAETGFESMKNSFSQGNYPAVLQINKEIKEISDKAEKDIEDEKKAVTGESEILPPGGIREQAIIDLRSAKELILEAEKLGYDVTESKKIYKQAEPAFRAGDYSSAINFAHDVEGSVNAMLGGKRLAKAPTVKPRYPGAPGSDVSDVKIGFFTRHHNLIFKYIIPITGLIILIAGASLAYIAWDDSIWNPFSGPEEWGPYNTTGVILGIVAVIVGILFAILPFFLTKKISVRMEQPKPIQMK